MRKLWFFAAVLWMALIFSFSNQKAAESGGISSSLTYRMADGFCRAFRMGWDEGTKKQIAEGLEHPVRKMAHMTEYAILAWIFLGNCMQYPFLRKKSYFFSWIFASVYAATDEFHQLFVEGRSGEVRDAAIDGAGAAIGLLLAWAAACAWKYYKKERGESNGRT